MNIPKEITHIAKALNKSGFRSYLVGGCVRDLLMKNPPAGGPKDWDITTNARPEQIRELFPESVYENTFGTVAVKTGSEDERLKIIEVTTFRIEGRYTDKRHPDEIIFTDTIEDDLSRRDFTVNALAIELPISDTRADVTLIDPYGGREDLEAKRIRAVGSPDERFKEDALRLVRAVRFALLPNFEIEPKTAEALQKQAALLEYIAKERIRDELTQIIMSPFAARGIQLLEDYGLLQYIFPELRDGINIGQNKHHIYTVWEHNLRALQYSADKNYSLIVRIASLLHDVGKPRTKRGEGENSTFYNHDIVGGKMALKMLDSMRFSKDIIEGAAHLVRYHLFYYNVGEVTEAGVRRFINRVGIESIDDLIRVREADRIGSGVPKAVPYKLRHLLFMIEKVRHDPIEPKMLAVNGEEVMSILNIKPGPRVGMILHILLEDVLDDAERNKKDYLKSRIKELGELSEKELRELAKEAKEKKLEAERGMEEEMKKKYWVK